MSPIIKFSREIIMRKIVVYKILVKFVALRKNVICLLVIYAYCNVRYSFVKATKFNKPIKLSNLLRMFNIFCVCKCLISLVPSWRKVDVCCFSVWRHCREQLCLNAETDERRNNADIVKT